MFIHQLNELLAPYLVFASVFLIGIPMAHLRQRGVEKSPDSKSRNTTFPMWNGGMFETYDITGQCSGFC